MPSSRITHLRAAATSVNPCTGARGATSHGTSVAVDLPGRKSAPGAQNTGIRGRLPAGRPGPASLQCRPADNRLEGYRDSNRRGGLFDLSSTSLSRGTEGSNPPPSSGESRANLSSSISCRRRCAVAAGFARGTHEKCDGASAGSGSRPLKVSRRAYSSRRKQLTGNSQLPMTVGLWSLFPEPRARLNTLLRAPRRR
jgi:hypothetical protein